MNKVEDPNISLWRASPPPTVLVVFNLVPAFPMDGGRVLTRGSPCAGQAPRHRISGAIGQVMAFVFGFLGLRHPLLVFIAIFVYLAAASEGSRPALKT